MILNAFFKDCKKWNVPNKNPNVFDFHTLGLKCFCLFMNDHFNAFRDFRSYKWIFFSPLTIVGRWGTTDISDFVFHWIWINMNMNWIWIYINKSSDNPTSWIDTEWLSSELYQINSVPTIDTIVNRDRLKIKIYEFSNSFCVAIVYKRFLLVGS